MPIGLDIGARSIRMLQLDGGPRPPVVAACGQFEFPPDATEPAARRAITIEAIRQLLRAGSFVGRRVVTALSPEAVSIKNVRLPRLPVAELDQAVQIEASERFGLDPSAGHFRFLRAGEVRSGDEVKQELILFGVADAALREHLGLLDELKLVPDAIEVGPCAVFRCFGRLLQRDSDKDVVTVCVDVGRPASRVLIARGSQIAFIKSIDIAGERFTRAVAERLELSIDEAEPLRRRLGPVDADAGADLAVQPVRDQVRRAVADAVREPIEQLAKEIQLCLRYYSVTFRGPQPERVIFVGGEASEPTLVGRMSEALGLPCEVGEPLRGIDTSAARMGSDRRGLLADWATAAGLALRPMETAALQEVA